MGRGRVLETVLLLINVFTATELEGKKKVLLVSFMWQVFYRNSETDNFRAHGSFVSPPPLPRILCAGGQKPVFFSLRSSRGQARNLARSRCSVYFVY